jgi:hypothetical protein
LRVDRRKARTAVLAIEPRVLMKLASEVAREVIEMLAGSAR